MKKPFKTAVLTAFILALSCLFSASAGAVDGGGLSVSSSELSAGDTFTVSVIVPPAPAADTASIEVNFSASAFEVTRWSPTLPGGIVNSGDGFFVVAAANAARSIDLSDGLELTATLSVKSGAAEGSYAFILTRHTLSYYSEDGNEHTDLWAPITSKVEVKVRSSSGTALQKNTAEENGDGAAAAETTTTAETTAAATTSAAETTTAATTAATTTTVTTEAQIKELPSAGDTTKPADSDAGQKGAPGDTTAGKRVNPHTGVSVAVFIPAVFTGCMVLAGRSLNKRKRAKKYIDDEEER